GLRAPPPPTAANISGAFVIEGVPEGKYVVLAAFENDNLVRDPDTAIAGTQIVHQTVTSGSDAAISSSFKVTGAITISSPGANDAEMVTAAPALTWAAYSSAATYDITVYDTFGTS